jgi:hypothetical protein
MAGLAAGICHSKLGGGIRTDFLSRLKKSVCMPCSQKVPFQKVVDVSSYQKVVIQKGRLGFRPV